MNTEVSPGLQSEILIELDNTMTGFLETLRSFDQEEFNQVPFAGSWTAGQVAEHVYKSCGKMPELLRGNTAKTERDPTEKVQELNEIFLDFSTKLKSPSFILPSEEPKDRDRMLQLFDRCFTELREIGRTEDLSQTCQDFEFPGSGKLTRLELLNFVHVHTKRHTHQLKKIRNFI